jgi:hypothetical protein
MSEAFTNTRRLTANRSVVLAVVYRTDSRDKIPEGSNWM